MEHIPAVNSMSILCLRNIQLTLDWDKMEPSNVYHGKIELYKRPGIFYQTIFTEIISNFRPARSPENRGNGH